MPAPSCSTQLAPAVTGIKTVMSVINFIEVYAAYCLMFITFHHLLGNMSSYVCSLPVNFIICVYERVSLSAA